MEDKIERQDRLRRRMLIGFVVAMIALYLPKILREALETELPDGLRGVLIVIGLVGSVLFVVYMMRLLIFGAKLAQSPGLAAVLLDERVRTVWSRACAVAFWVVITLLAAASALPAVAWAFTDSGAVVSERVGAVVADAGLLVGVVTAITAFLVLDRG